MTTAMGDDGDGDVEVTWIEVIRERKDERGKMSCGCGHDGQDGMKPLIVIVESFSFFGKAAGVPRQVSLESARIADVGRLMP
jgi:hypothetical protein